MLNKSNGRIDIIQPPSSIDQFKLYDKSVMKSTPYTDAVQGIYYDTVLSQNFFSAENIKILQNGIRAGVYEKSKEKFVIGEQDSDTLKVIMRSMFLQHSINSPSKVKEQIDDLNKIVLEYAIPKVYGEAIGYMNYCRDSSTIAIPLNYPVMSRSNEKQLEENPWIRTL
uniref:Minor capsid protein P8 central region domain-containing protein n=1 Tax=viral metagenome TaxID=1070528 RepID=A0A6C0LGU8_9ZZZZ|tara:strand:+ start:5409 stop:5912 length:504 start_codon:yes stop_codon:yes gene_type:complete